MRRIKLQVSHLKNVDMEADNCFAHRIYGAIGLTKALIAKQAIALRKFDAENNNFAMNLSQSEIDYIEECINDYNKCLKQKKPEKLSDDDFEYGVDFKLSEIAELFDERAQRKIDLNLAFAQVINDTHARRTAIRLAVTRG